MQILLQIACETHSGYHIYIDSKDNIDINYNTT